MIRFISLSKPMVWPYHQYPFSSEKRGHGARRSTGAQIRHGKKKKAGLGPARLAMNTHQCLIRNHAQKRQVGRNPGIRAKRILLAKVVAEAAAKIRQAGNKLIKVCGLYTHHCLQRGSFGLFHENIKMAGLA